MKTIGKDELYRNVSAFMKSKGIELTDGAYAGHIRRGCDLLSDAINAAQRTVTRAKKEVDEKLAQLRRCIHDATAPPSPGAAPAPAADPTTGAGPAPARKPAGKPSAKPARKRVAATKPAPTARRARRSQPAA